MKFLIFASAMPMIVKKCIVEFSNNQLTVLIPNNAYSNYEDLFDKPYEFVRISTNRFDNVPRQDISNILPHHYDSLVVVSSELAFLRFSNVLSIVAKLKFKQLLLYNREGKIEVIKVPNILYRRFEYFFITVAMRFLSIEKQIELFAERGYIRCAELLDL